FCRERPERDHERAGSDGADGAADDQHARDDALELRIHVRTLTFDAAIFDFDETMIELEAQHTAASEALCRDLGGDYSALPESFRLSSGPRILDEVREMREQVGWKRPLEEVMIIRQRIFSDGSS